MRLFVTGVCGRLGRAIAAEAPAHGHTVCGIDLDPWPVDTLALPRGVDVHLASFEDLPTVERLLPGCDAIIHTAGPHGEFVTTLDLAGFLRANVECVASLLEAAARQGLRRVALSSTMEVLVGRDWRASGAAVVDERSAPATDSAYGVSRLLQEHMGRELSRIHRVSIASLRYMAFGYREDRLLGPALLARSITAADAARACIAATGIDGLRGDVFNIGPNTPLTDADIFAAARDPEGVVEKHFPGAVEVLRASGHRLTFDDFWPVTRTRKAQLVLGWEPRYTFATWLLEHGWRPSRL